SVIFVAKLQGCRSSERVAQYSYARQVEPSRELARYIRGVQLLQPIEGERHVHTPRSQQPVRTALPLLAHLLQAEFRVVLRQPSHHTAVWENNSKGAVRRVEADDNIAVTCQILCECRVIPHLGGGPRSQDRHRPGSLLRRAVRGPPEVRV